MKLKNVFIYFLIAVVAGFVAVFTYSKIDRQDVEQMTYRERYPTWYTSLPQDFDTGRFDFTYAAERTVHGVVNVATTSMRQRTQRGRQDPFYDFFFGPQNREPQPVEGIGSGVIISELGHFLAVQPAGVDGNEVVQLAEVLPVLLYQQLIQCVRHGPSYCSMATSTPGVMVPEMLIFSM